MVLPRCDGFLMECPILRLRFQNRACKHILFREWYRNSGLPIAALLPTCGQIRYAQLIINPDGHCIRPNQPKNILVQYLKRHLLFLQIYRSSGTHLLLLYLRQIELLIMELYNLRLLRYTIQIR